MAVFNRVQLGVEKTGVSASVPDNPKARLMYYLNCMCSILEIDDDDDIGALRDYKNYYLLSEEKTNQLLLMCALLEPTTLMNKCIFQSDAMCGDSGNEFYKLNEVKSTLAVANSLMIGGTRRRVQKIMTFKMSWLRTNFLNPFKELTETMENTQRQRQRQKKDDGCSVM